MNEGVIVGWSGGKDSVFALYENKRTMNYEVVTLLTTITRDYDRISIHGLRRALLEQQAEKIGLTLEKMYIRKGASNAEYERNLLEILKRYADQGVVLALFGDIFLEDIRRYRENTLSKVGMRGIFPLWKKNTHKLAETFINCGFKAIITVVDSNVLGKEFVGREFNKHFLADLPMGVDQCGENGEFHSFVYNGPLFKNPVAFTKGEVALRETHFWHCDLIPY